MAIYIVWDGAATQADDGFPGSAAPPAGLYGSDWIVVEASSARDALAAGGAYDADRRTGPDALIYDEAHARAKLTYLGGT